MGEFRGITVKIGGKEFGIEIPINDELVYRRAAKEVNTRIATYQSSLKGQPDDFIYLAALHIAVSKVRSELNEQTARQAEMLDAINGKLDEFISSSKIK